MGSLPTGVPDALESTEAAREWASLEPLCGNLALAAFAGVDVAGVPGVLAGVQTPLRLRLMMFVSSLLNCSRSASAAGWRDVKVKLWPASSFTSPTFKRTCGAPSLLENRAWEPPNVVNEGLAGQRHSQTDTQPQHEQL